MLDTIGSSTKRWWVILIISILGIAFVVFSSLIADRDSQSQIVTGTQSMVGSGGIMEIVREIGSLFQNDAIQGSAIALFAALISLSIIFIYKIPEMRKISIRLLANGYYENFLSGVIDKVHSQGGGANSVLIILPGYSLVNSRIRYWNKFQAILKRLDFELVQETTDKDFGRNVFTVQKKAGSAYPIFIDMPTTLTNLKTVIEMESNSPIGTLNDTKVNIAKFYELRQLFQDELQHHVEENDLGNVRYIEGKSLPEFEAELTGILENLEQ